eukprot:252109-Heterocapsa_arctica.AAC.1
MVPYNAAVDNLVRGIGAEGNSLYKDVHASADVSVKDKELRRARSQDPSQHCSDRPASEAKQMNYLSAAAGKALHDKKGSFDAIAQANVAPGN